MSRDLREVLGQNSNILNFQKKYIMYPCLSYGKGVFQFLFPKTGFPENFNELEEKTSLQRAVKELSLRGGYILEYNGLIF